MRKVFTILGIGTLAMFGTRQLQAQTNLRFGLKGGLNLSHAHSEIDDQSALDADREYNGFGPGFHAGALAELSFPKGSKFKLQLEGLYNLNFMTLKEASNNDIQNKFTLHSVQVPLSVRYFIVPDFSFNAGLSANFNVAAYQKMDNGDYKNIKDDVNITPMQLGLHAGATYYIHKGFFVEARYNYFLGDVMTSKHTNLYDLDYNTGTLQLGLGYKFE